MIKINENQSKSAIQGNQKEDAWKGDMWKLAQF